MWDFSPGLYPNRIRGILGAIIDATIFSILVGIFFFLIWLAVMYWVIKTAVRHALISHYKTVRLYERTGTWEPGPHSTGEPMPIPAKV